MKPPKPEGSDLRGYVVARPAEFAPIGGLDCGNSGPPSRWMARSVVIRSPSPRVSSPSSLRVTRSPLRRFLTHSAILPVRCKAVSLRRPVDPQTRSRNLPFVDRDSKTRQRGTTTPAGSGLRTRNDAWISRARRPAARATAVADRPTAWGAVKWHQSEALARAGQPWRWVQGRTTLRPRSTHVFRISCSQCAELRVPGSTTVNIPPRANRAPQLARIWTPASMLPGPPPQISRREQVNTMWFQ